MSRRRYLSTNISNDDRVLALVERQGEFAGLLYSWMIVHSADDRTITANPRELLLLVVPGFRWRTPEDVGAAVDAMLDLGLVKRQNGALLFPERSYYKYQTYIAAARRSHDDDGPGPAPSAPPEPTAPPPPDPDPLTGEPVEPMSKRRNRSARADISTMGGEERASHSLTHSHSQTNGSSVRPSVDARARPPPTL